MKVFEFKDSRNAHHNQLYECREWIRLVGSFRFDATVELSKIYQTLEPDTVLDDDTVSNASGFLHSSKHVYIYQFDSWEPRIHYGNSCKLWPVDNKSLWPWSVALKEVPRLVRDIWNIIFCKLAPCDILALGKVCRQLREYAHDPRAWKHFTGLSVDWKFYRDLKKCKWEYVIVQNFIRLICVPHGYGNGQIDRKNQYGVTTYQIGELRFQKEAKKRSYIFAADQWSICPYKFTVPRMRAHLKEFLNKCTGNFKAYPLEKSPVKGWIGFTQFIDLTQ